MHLTDGKIGFVFSGRLCAETRVEELLACWGKAVATRDDLRLILVGSGPDAAELHERARVLGVGDKVFLQEALLATISVYAFPSVRLLSVRRIPSRWKLPRLRLLRAGCPSS